MSPSPREVRSRIKCLTNLTRTNHSIRQVRPATASPRTVRHDVLRLVSRGGAPIHAKFYHIALCFLSIGIHGIFGHHSFAGLKVFGRRQLARTIRQIRKADTPRRAFPDAMLHRHEKNLETDWVVPRRGARASPESKGATLNTKWPATCAFSGTSTPGPPGCNNCGGNLSSLPTSSKPVYAKGQGYSLPPKRAARNSHRRICGKTDRLHAPTAKFESRARGIGNRRWDSEAFTGAVVAPKPF